MIDMYPSDRGNVKGETNVLVVEGDGEMIVDADEISLIIGVVTEDLDVVSASEDNARRSNQVLTALMNAGIPSTQIETIVYNVQPVYDFQNGQSVFRGFRVEHLYKVKLNDVKLAGIVYDTAIKNGANITRDLSFEVTNPSRYYLNGLAKAYEDAVRKAMALAHMMRVQLSPVPLKIVEIAARDVAPFYKTQMVQALAAPPIQPQKVLIRAKLKIWFCYF
ncbi:SIMPL domain-containing protein [Bacillus sp. Marseille-Q3570]|uniref:SIMPL domain-containing protein n=1 Tax=Bacillus sp. Marseille-Q3570 TaxID=2963522 RepID=UPI0021B8232F|nr:SIMPL domain-containing protein [Bacillus sp. Marseille-Q3570]